MRNLPLQRHLAQTPALLYSLCLKLLQLQHQPCRQ
jgi:hypothetical protein